MTARPQSRDSSDESKPRSAERPAATPPSFLETERQSAELAAMRRMLTASRGTFSISIAVCNSPALRDYLVGRLLEDDSDYVAVSVPRETEDFLDYTCADLGSRSPSAVLLIDLEKSLPSEGPRPAIGLLNATREKWQKHFPCPIVFWLPEYAVKLLSVEARDFWAWRSHQFEFVADLPEPAATMSESFAGGGDAVLNLDADRKQFRIAELRERINAVGKEAQPAMMLHLGIWLTELGILLTIVGQLDEAERTHRKCLKVNETLGRPEGMGASYNNLALIHRARGELNEAEKMARKSLEINEKLGRLEGMGTSWNNLGLIFQTRGDLDEAEEMLRKSLEIDEKLGRLGGMAIQYSNLGLIFEARGQLDEAAGMYRKALEIDKNAGRLEGVASSGGNLGIIFKKRGDLDEAERMLRKALEIHEKLGEVEGIATDYYNLGAIFQLRGELDEARKLWTKARDLYAKMGLPHMGEDVQGWLDRL